MPLDPTADFLWIHLHGQYFGPRPRFHPKAIQTAAKNAALATAGAASAEAAVCW